MLNIFRNKLVLAALAFIALSGSGAYFGKDYVAGYLPTWLGGTTAASEETADAAGDEATGQTAADGDSVAATPANSANPGQNKPISATPVRAGQPRPLMVGTFNIQKFGETKMSKSDVVAKLQELALPFDVLAIQEVVSQDAAVIKNFVADLNQKHGVAFNYVTGPWMGDTSYKESYAFIFDTTRVQLVEHPFVVADPDNKMHREPLVARFQVRSDSEETTPFSFLLVNVHTDPDLPDQEMDHVSDVVSYLEQLYAGTEDDILVLGDFNLAPDDVKAKTKFGARTGWDSVLGPAVMTNTASNKAYDNIIYREETTTEFLGNCGVINLMAKFKIQPDKAAEISDHMPVWAAFSLTEAPATRVAAAETQPSLN